MAGLPMQDSAPSGITITMMTMSSEGKGEKSPMILPRRILRKLWKKGEFNCPERSEREVANHGS